VRLVSETATTALRKKREATHNPTGKVERLLFLWVSILKTASLSLLDQNRAEVS